MALFWNYVAWQIKGFVLLLRRPLPLAILRFVFGLSRDSDGPHSGEISATFQKYAQWVSSCFFAYQALHDRVLM